jgi:hypothetical protein
VPEQRPPEIDLKTLRHLYAEKVRVVANLRSPALAQAFARIPRGHFLGLGLELAEGWAY